MKNYYPARGISEAKKVLLIEKAVQGTPISSICKEENISRTIFYRWIRQHNLQTNSGYSGIKRTRKKICVGKINARLEQKVINYAIRKPKYTIRQYASYSGLSVRSVWIVLKEKNLSTRQQREAYFLSTGNRIYHYPSHGTKFILLKRSQNGEKINKLCKETGISRTIFYKWLNQYKEAGDRFEGLLSQRPTGDKHYRYIKGLDKYILAVVRNNPDYSLSQILAGVTEGDNTVVSRSGVYKVLKRLGLTSLQDRLAYARSAKAIEVQPAAVSDEPLPAIPHYLFISFLPPPERDLAYLLHILFFDDLHPESISTLNCEVCSLIQLQADPIARDDEQFKEEQDE